MGNGDRMTGGVSLVSKFKVTNLVLVKDEKLTAVHMDFLSIWLELCRHPVAFWHWHLSAYLEISLYSWDRILWFWARQTVLVRKQNSANDNMDGSLKSWLHFPHLNASHGHLLQVQSQLHFQSHSTNDTSTGLSLSAMKLTLDGVPETAISARVHLEHVKKQPKGSV